MSDNEAFKAALEDFSKNHPKYDSYALQAFCAGWLACRAAPVQPAGSLREESQLLLDCMRELSMCDTASTTYYGVIVRLQAWKAALTPPAREEAVRAEP